MPDHAAAAESHTRGATGAGAGGDGHGALRDALIRQVGHCCFSGRCTLVQGDLSTPVARCAHKCPEPCCWCVTGSVTAVMKAEGAQF